MVLEGRVTLPEITIEMLSSLWEGGVNMDPNEQSEQMEEVRSSERGFVDEEPAVEPNDDESSDDES